MKRIFLDSFALTWCACGASLNAAELMARFSLDENGESGAFVPSTVTDVEFGNPSANRI